MNTTPELLVKAKREAKKIIRKYEEDYSKQSKDIIIDLMIKWLVEIYREQNL